MVEGSGNGYLRTVGDYVHLNPVRAGLLPPEAALESFRWSSYGAYLRPPGQRPGCLRVDRLLGEKGIPNWDEGQLRTRRKGHRAKVMLACRLRQETTTSLKWIAQRLQMGSWTYVSNLLNEPKHTQPQAQKELLLCQ